MPTYSENTQENIVENLFWDMKEQLYILITDQQSGSKTTSAQRFLCRRIPHNKLLYAGICIRKNAAWRIIKKESVKLNIIIVEW